MCTLNLFLLLQYPSLNFISEKCFSYDTSSETMCTKNEQSKAKKKDSKLTQKFIVVTGRPKTYTIFIILCHQYTKLQVRNFCFFLPYIFFLVKMGKLAEWNTRFFVWLIRRMSKFSQSRLLTHLCVDIFHRPDKANFLLDTTFFFVYTFLRDRKKATRRFCHKRGFRHRHGVYYYGFEVDGWRTLIFFAVNTLRVNKLFWGKSVWQCWVQCFPYSCIFTSTHSITSFSSSFIQFIFLHFIFCTFLCLNFFLSRFIQVWFLVDFFYIFLYFGWIGNKKIGGSVSKKALSMWIKIPLPFLDK